MKKILLLIFMTIIFAGCSTETPVEVKTEKVLSSRDAVTVIHDGKISLSKKLKIFSPSSGNVIEKYIEDGSDVTEGQKLFKVNSLETQSDFLQAKKNLAQSKTALAKALVENDPAASELQLEAEKNLALVQKLEEEFSGGIIYSPKSGRLGNSVAPQGMPVVENETVLAIVGNIDPAVVTVELSETETEILSASTDLKISLKLGDGEIYPYKGTFKNGEIFFENPDELLIPDEPAQIEIDNIKISNGVLVPENAIRKDGAGNFVFINENDKVAIRQILLGDKIGTYYIVKDGLTAEDSVIVDGSINLREGTPLKER